MSINSSIRGITLAVGGLLVLAGVALATGGTGRTTHPTRSEPRQLPRPSLPSAPASAQRRAPPRTPLPRPRHPPSRALPRAPKHGRTLPRRPHRPRRMLRSRLWAHYRERHSTTTPMTTTIPGRATPTMTTARTTTPGRATPTMTTAMMTTAATTIPVPAATTERTCDRPDVGDRRMARWGRG